MTTTNFIQRYRTSGTKITAIALAVVLVSQLLLSTLAQAADNNNGNGNGNGNNAPKPSANLDQCANGPFSSPVNCTGANWQNGNLNVNNSHYAEGQSAPYRIVMSDLPTTGTITLVIEYDIKNSSKHAIDYLTSFDRTESSADPCSGVTGCSLTDTEAFPAPSSSDSPVAGMPTASFNALPSTERELSLYNATIAGTGITYASEGSLAGANTSTQIQIQFTASSSTVVFAWGGHIGSASDWGSGNSASAVNGSPYHMRLVSLTGANLGNQDRSLSADAVTSTPSPGVLNVIKNVVNNDGGTSVASNFTMNVTGTNVSTASFPGSETGTSVTLDAGSYSVSETLASGYAVSYSTDCTGTIAAGETKTCTVTNNDIAQNPTTGTLIVIKNVINDNGGTAVSTDFTMNVTGTNVSSSSFLGSATGTSVTLDAGSYGVTEGAAAGYADSYSADCTGTIAAGETKTCTVTNDDIAPTLTVIKTVINDNDGQSVASAFTMNVTGTDVSSASFPGSASGTSVTLDAGTYSVTESAATGYLASYSNDCSGSIAIGESKTCTVTNDDIAPQQPLPANLIVIKTVINDNGGQSSASAFTLNVTGTNVSQSSFNGSATGTNVTLSAGSYEVTESPASGYTVSYSEECDGTIAAGQTVTCTVTNNDIFIPEGPTQGTLTVLKVVINNDGGTSVIADFPLFIDSTTTTSGTQNSLPAGQYVVNEISSPDYVASFSGDCDVNGVVNLEDGDTKTCTITNDDKAPTPPGGSAPSTGSLIVVTVVNNEGGGEAMPASFLMTVGDGVSTSSTFGGTATPGFPMSYAPGAYVVNGSTLPNYSQSMSANCSGTMLAGQTVTCVVTYTYQAAPTGGSPTPPPAPPAPAPQVLGATDSATAPAPVPQVLGATDSDLPVTGMPAWTLLSVLLAAAPFLSRKRA